MSPFPPTKFPGEADAKVLDLKPRERVSDTAWTAWVKAVSLLGWVAGRRKGHLLKWYALPSDGEPDHLKNLTEYEFFHAIDGQRQKNAVDDVESRVEVLNILNAGMEHDPTWAAQYGPPLKFVNGLSDPNEVMDAWMRIKGEAKDHDIEVG